MQPVSPRRLVLGFAKNQQRAPPSPEDVRRRTVTRHVVAEAVNCVLENNVSRSYPLVILMRNLRCLFPSIMGVTVPIHVHDDDLASMVADFLSTHYVVEKDTSCHAIGATVRVVGALN